MARPLDRDRASVVPADYSRRHPLAWRMLTPLLGGRGRRVSAVRLAEQVPLVELDIRVPVRSRRRAVWVSNLTKPLRNLLTR